MKREEHSIDLKDSNLKVTPQRIAVLEALNNLRDHPTADKIKEYVVKNHTQINCFVKGDSFLIYNPALLQSEK